MLKREISYVDFNDDPQTEIFYFNISKPDLMELDVEKKGGLANWLRSIVEIEDRKELLDIFKRIVLLAYGEKSADGKSFVKTEEIRTAFTHTAAYEALFLELASDAESAANFLLGVLPKDLTQGVNTEDLLALNDEKEKSKPPAVSAAPTPPVPSTDS